MVLAYFVFFCVIFVVVVLCVYRKSHGGFFTNSKVRMSYVALNRLTIAYRIAGYRHVCTDRRLLHLFREDFDMKFINIQYKYIQDEASHLFPDEQYKGPDKIFATGVVLEEDGNSLKEEDCQILANLGYHVYTFPSIPHAITAVYAINSMETLAVAANRVYPVVENIISEHHLCAYPQIEIYNKNYIQIIIPLSRQLNFYVPEAVPRSPYHWYLNSVQSSNQRSKTRQF